jgi:predicted nucleic acid binding AN1-type Zn finger protein
VASGSQCHLVMAFAASHISPSPKTYYKTDIQVPNQMAKDPQKNKTKQKQKHTQSTKARAIRHHQSKIKQIEVFKQ